MSKEFDEIMDKAWEALRAQANANKKPSEFDEIMDEAVKVFEAQQAEEQDVFEDETLVLRKATMTKADYYYEEHRLNNHELPDYPTTRVKLHTQYELLDMALLVRDFKWAKALHKKITELEEKVKQKELDEL